MSASVRTLVVAAACVLSLASRSRAQDFDAPAPRDAVLASRSSAAVLERGLPQARGGIAVQCVEVAWHSVPGLVTRAAVLAAGWRAVRVGLGVSQTGDEGLGWSSAGAALGMATARGGAALRAVARRDRMPDGRWTRLGAGVGLEAGAGAWLTSAGVTLWASAPQMWRAGLSPPLRRPLAIGVGWSGDGVHAWLSRTAPVTRDPGRGENTAGTSLDLGAAAAWVEARDAPLRGTLGMSARLRALEVAASVESHPVLGETLRLGVALAAGRRR